MTNLNINQLKRLVLFVGLTLISSCGASKELVPDFTDRIKSEIGTEKKSLFEKMKENDHLSIEDRIALYHQLKKKHYDEYDFKDVRQLNQYGYSLLENDRVKEAIEIFKLLVSEFPNSFNAYDSLGEGYMKDGNDELAIVNYEKSIELNPNNTHGIDQLTILKGLEILVTDWGKEFFHFPLHFAPDIPLEGVEEVVFPIGWNKADSAEFWSYVFVWELDNRKEMSPGELERILKRYFDGLMEVVNDDPEAEMIKTSAHFFENEDPSDNAKLMGDLTIFDAFTTNKPLTLNAKMFSKYCKEREKLILLFHFSPQDYSHWIWFKLGGEVFLRKTICEE